MNAGASFSPSGHPQTLPVPLRPAPLVQFDDCASSDVSASPSPKPIPPPARKPRLRRTATRGCLAPPVRGVHQRYLPSSPPTIARATDLWSPSPSASSSPTEFPESLPQLAASAKDSLLLHPRVVLVANDDDAGKQGTEHHGPQESLSNHGLHEPPQRSPRTSTVSQPVHLEPPQLQQLVQELFAQLQPLYQAAASAQAPVPLVPSPNENATAPCQCQRQPSPQNPTSIPTPPSTDESPEHDRRSLSSLSSIPVPTPYVHPAELPSISANASPRQDDVTQQHAALVLEDLRLAAEDSHQKLTLASENLGKEEHALRRARRLYERAVRKERERGREEPAYKQQRRDARAACKQAECTTKTATLEYKTAILAEDQARRAYLDVANALSRHGQSPRAGTASVNSSPGGRRASVVASNLTEHAAACDTSTLGYQETSREPVVIHREPTLVSIAAPVQPKGESRQQHCGDVTGVSYPERMPEVRCNVAYMSRHVEAVLKDALSCTDKLHQLAEVVCAGQDFFSLTPSAYIEIALERLMSAAVHGVA